MFMGFPSFGHLRPLHYFLFAPPDSNSNSVSFYQKIDFNWTGGSASGIRLGLSTYFPIWLDLISPFQLTFFHVKISWFYSVFPAKHCSGKGKKLFVCFKVRISNFENRINQPRKPNFMPTSRRPHTMCNPNPAKKRPLPLQYGGVYAATASIAAESYALCIMGNDAAIRPRVTAQPSRYTCTACSFCVVLLAIHFPIRL